MSFCRFIIYSCELAKKKDFEMFNLFFECLLAKTNVNPVYKINLGMMRQVSAWSHMRAI